MKNLRLLLPLVVLATAPALSAAVITFTDTLPSTNVILSNANTISAGGNLQIRNTGGTDPTNNRWVGSGFKAATTTTLDKVTLLIANDTVNANALGATMTIAFVSLTSQTAAPSQPYSPFYSETASVPSTYANENYITFDLATPISLTANSYYGFLVYFNDPKSTRGINITTTPGSTAGTGNNGSLFFTYDQGATYTTSSNPVNFVLQAVPEPSMVALLAISACGAAIAVTRKRRIAA